MPIFLDIVDVNVLAQLGLDILDRNNLIVDKVTGHLWNRIFNIQHPLKYEDRWKSKLIRHGEHLYVQLKATLRLFYIMGRLHKLQKNSQPSAVKLYDL